MFYGVSGQPFVDLAPHLDLTGLDAVVGELHAYLFDKPKSYQHVCFGDLQEVHPSSAGETHLGHAVRLVSLHGETNAETLERADLAYEMYASRDLPATMALIRSLPLKGVGRSSIYFSRPGDVVPVHRDYVTHPGINNQFVFLNPVLKPFYVLDAAGEKHFIDTPASIFNPSDFHGMDACDRNTFTIRVNGFYRDELVEAAGLKEHFGDR
jgi:hypothetical protein